MAEPTSTSISYHYEIEDYLEARRLIRGQSFRGKIDKVVFFVFACFGSYWAAYSLVTFEFHWWEVIFLLMTLIAWEEFPPLRKWVTTASLKRNPQFQEDYYATFSRERMHIKTATQDSNMQWSFYNSFIEGQTVFLLVYGKNLYVLIPKRSFASSEEVDAFRMLLQQTIPVPVVPPLALP